MPDQAETLRKLVVDAAPHFGTNAALPPTIVVTGGKGGVGTTTVAINLAAALVQHGRRTVLVDAAPHADVAQLLGVEVARGRCLDDVLSGAIATTDALSAGPAGISLLAGQWAAERSPDRSHHSFDRLFEQLSSLDAHADAIVIDIGRGTPNWTDRLWLAADLVLLVTTPADLAVMDTYATIKRSVSVEENIDLRVLVNACHETATATDVQNRLEAVCRRFLGRSIGRAPLLPRHVGPLDAAYAPPLAWEVMASPFARCVRQLGRFAADVLAHHQRVRPDVYELSRC